MRLLQDWFLKNARDFPWRKNKSAYRVWISEVMLQQTRAQVVISYFERWMQLFPTIESLAKAPLAQVIKAWEGLGYYQRARSIHQAAKEIVERFEGKLPSTYEELKTLAGLGPYTIGAILNFGFEKKALAIDGNVTRVISRYFLIEKEISLSSTKKEIEEKVLSILPEKNPWITSEALIELGALICKPKPLCSLCPLALSCRARLEKKEALLPIKKAKAETILLNRFVIILKKINSDSKEFYLVKQETNKKLMKGLHEFLYFEKNPTILKTNFFTNIAFIKSFPKVTHTFTKYKAHLFPLLFQIDCNDLNFEKNLMQIKEGFSDYIWIEKKKLKELAFSAGHKKIVLEILK